MKSLLAPETLGEAPVHIQALPPDPAEFTDKFPIMAHHFSDECPVDCEFDTTLMLSTVEAWPTQPQKSAAVVWDYINI